MSRVKNAFSYFCKTPADIYCIKSGSGYSSAAEKEYVCTVSADIQPYSGQLEEREFGLDAVKRFKMYCSDNENICEGNYVKFDDEMHRITYAERWSMGITALIERVCSDD